MTVIPYSNFSRKMKKEQNKVRHSFAPNWQNGSVCFMSQKKKKTIYYLVLICLPSSNSSVKWREPYSLSWWKRIVAGPQAQIQPQLQVTSCTFSSVQRQDLNCCIWDLEGKSCGVCINRSFWSFFGLMSQIVTANLLLYPKQMIKLQKQHGLNKATICFRILYMELKT